MNVCSISRRLLIFYMLSYTGSVLGRLTGEPQAAWRTSTGYVGQYRNPNFCPANSQCLPIASCPLLNNILSHSCVISNRVGELGCGYQGSGLVCCPKTQDTVSTNTNKYNSVQKCGEPAVQGQEYNGIGAHPWVVRIGFKNVATGEVKYPCSGSIINRQLILTAAHCALATAQNFKLYSVRIGEYITNAGIDCGEEFCGLPVQDIFISHVIVHQGYQKQSYKDNIALIVLRTPINYTVTAQPICLPETWSVSNNNGILVGWGKAAGQTETPVVQQILRLPVVSLQQCVNVYGGTLPITENHLCAGGEVGQDACSGFGGAPLMIRQGDVYYQIGILSFGSDRCGAAGIPSVYTNVKNYISWIKENIPTAHQ